MKRNIAKILFIVFCLIGSNSILAQNDTDSGGDEFIRVVNETLHDYYLDFSSTKRQTDSIISAFGYDDKDVPTFSDEVYCERLSILNENSPFEYDCNDIALSSIKFFSKERRHFTSVLLGRSKLYFPMFEEKLAKHNLPLELKYLAVIESGLRPQVKSRAGALGLWQFMYRTGKYYGLNQTSYVDERMDPEMATEAACAYLGKLHSLYDDWWMALAAYNAGPGNVNKAIRRSGGKMTYWEIRPYLPRETQGYVPNFIAMSYMMNYAAEHNVKKREAKFYDFQIDTVCLKKGIHMETIDSLLSWNIEDIKALNPVFKTSYIPTKDPNYCLSIPATFVSDWVALEDSLYVLDSLMYQKNDIEKIIESREEPDNAIVHRVTKGQTLGHIANRYGTTVRKIMDWNNLRSTNLAIGQRLSIFTKGAAPKPTTAKPATEVAQKPTKAAEPTTGAIHTISAGESLWAIANKSDTTVEELLKLNPGIDYKDLKVGQKIRIR